MYSPACRNVKYNPRAIVSANAWIVFFRFVSRSLWCAHVTVTPDANRTAVFRSGTLNGLSGLIPVGGQAQPNSGVGANLLWKNAQKNAKKNSTSDVINRIIPHRKPFVTYVVWWPIKVLSRITSRHHWIIDIMIKNVATKRPIVVWRWNHDVNPSARESAPKEAVNGQGLISTRWNGCRTIIIFEVKLVAWKVTVLFILRLYNIYKGDLLINKFTVYCYYFSHLIIVSFIFLIV